MIFIFGLVVAAIITAVAQLALGIPLLFLRGFGLLWGDRRLWWTLAFVLTITTGWFLVASSHDYAVHQDSIHRGFVGFQKVGVVFGGVLVWVFGIVLFCFWGKKWRRPIAKIAPAMSVVCVAAIVAACAILPSAPAEIRASRAERDLQWVQALIARDLEEVARLAAREDVRWSHIEQIEASPVSYAIREKDANLLRALVESRPNSLARSEEVAQALAYGGDMDLLRLHLEIFEQHPKVKGECLCYAAERGREDFMAYLLDEGANPNFKVSQSALVKAVFGGHKSAVQRLLRRGADVNALSNSASPYTAETALQAAVQAKNPPMVEFLLSSGAETDLRHTGSMTPLMRAVRDRNLEVMRILLRAGASVGASDKRGNTALHIATQGHRTPDMQVVELLLASGSNPHIQNNHGFAPQVKILKTGGGSLGLLQQDR